MRRALCTLLFLSFAIVSAEAKIRPQVLIWWHDDVRPASPPLLLDVQIRDWATLTPAPTGTIEVKRFGALYATVPAMGVHTVEVEECGYSFWTAEYGGDANYEASTIFLWAGTPCPIPTITAINPDHIYPDQTEVVVAISGFNFTPETIARLATPNTTGQEISARYISPSEIEVRVPIALFGPNPQFPAAGRLWLDNGGTAGNQVPFDALPRSTTIRYDNAGHMTAEVTPGIKAVWLRGGRYVNDAVPSTDALVVGDVDFDGVVSYDCGALRPYTTWIVAELGNAAWQARYSSLITVGTTRPPAGLIERGAGGALSRLVLSGWDGEIHFLWLRAGVGAWDLVTADDRPGDQWPLWGRIEVTADQFRSMTGAATPGVFERGDFLAVVNAEGRYFATILDDALLAPTAGSGSISAIGGAGIEGNPVIVSFLRNGGSDGTASLHYATRDRTAIAGVNYTSTAGALSFGPGEFVKSVAIPTVSYAMYGGPSLLFDLDVSVEGATLETATPLACTIDDADPRPLVSTSPSCVQEGDGPYTIPLKFTITPARMPIKVTWKGQCLECCNHDRDCFSDHYFCYQDCFAGGSFVLAPGETEHEVIVNQVGDTQFNGDRTIRIVITSDVAVASSSSLAIADNDPPRLYVIGNPVVTEGNSGVSDLSFSLWAEPGPLRPPGPFVAPCQAQGVADYETVDGTAHAGTDYAASRGTIQTGQSIAIPVNGDRFLEPDETFNVRFFNARNGILDRDSITATIVNDDAATTVPVTVGSTTVMEGASGSDMAMLPVTLDTPAAYAYDVPWITRDGTAVAGSDYTASAGTLTFAEGEKEKLIAVPVLADSIPEIDETFDVIAGNQATGRVTIKDTDGLPALFVNDITVVEGAGGRQSAATFEVKLSRPSGACVTVEYATADATAVAPRDYAVTHGLLTFEPGEISKSVTVPIAGDNDAEPAEQFYLTLNWPNNATMGRPLGLCTIVNDDGRRRASGH